MHGGNNKNIERPLLPRGAPRRQKTHNVFISRTASPILIRKYEYRYEILMQIYKYKYKNTTPNTNTNTNKNTHTMLTQPTLGTLPLGDSHVDKYQNTKTNTSQAQRLQKTEKDLFH